MTSLEKIFVAFDSLVRKILNLRYPLCFMKKAEKYKGHSCPEKLPKSTANWIGFWIEIFSFGPTTCFKPKLSKMSYFE